MAMAERGAFDFHPNHHFDAVGPMTGMTTKSQPVMIVENRAFGNRAYCTINEGLGKVMRFGGNDEEVRAKLAWLRDDAWAGARPGPSNKRRHRTQEHHRAWTDHGR